LIIIDTINCVEVKGVVLSGSKHEAITADIVAGEVVKVDVHARGADLLAVGEGYEEKEEEGCC
jgi:hypothetical protein